MIEAKSSIDLLRRSSLATTSASARPWPSRSRAKRTPGRFRSFALYPASSITSTRCQPRRWHSERMAARCAARPAPLPLCSSVLTRTYARTTRCWPTSHAALPGASGCLAAASGQSRSVPEQSSQVVWIGVSALPLGDQRDSGPGLIGCLQQPRTSCLQLALDSEAVPLVSAAVRSCGRVTRALAIPRRAEHSALP